MSTDEILEFYKSKYIKSIYDRYEQAGGELVIYKNNYPKKNITLNDMSFNEIKESIKAFSKYDNITNNTYIRIFNDELLSRRTKIIRKIKNNLVV